jgi:hypothetical protein
LLNAFVCFCGWKAFVFVRLGVVEEEVARN